MKKIKKKDKVFFNSGRQSGKNLELAQGIAENCSDIYTTLFERPHTNNKKDAFSGLTPPLHEVTFEWDKYEEKNESSLSKEKLSDIQELEAKVSLLESAISIFSNKIGDINTLEERVESAEVVLTKVKEIVNKSLKKHKSDFSERIDVGIKIITKSEREIKRALKSIDPDADLGNKVKKRINRAVEETNEYGKKSLIATSRRLDSIGAKLVKHIRDHQEGKI